LEDGIAHEKAVKLMGSKPYNLQHNKHLEESERNSKPAQWTTVLQNHLFVSNSKLKLGPLLANETTLRSLQTRQVIMQNSSSSGQRQQRYFYIIDPTFAAHQCSLCNHFFEQEEWDAAVLKEGCCPFCRKKMNSKTYGWSVY
jgi:intraflagellar transport protein 122